jgi:hypothetical protein
MDGPGGGSGGDEESGFSSPSRQQPHEEGSIVINSTASATNAIRYIDENFNFSIFILLNQ